MAEVTLVATLGVPTSPRGEEIEQLPTCVRWLEVRADRVGDLNPDWLRSHFHGSLLYTLRSKDQGGSSRGTGGCAASGWQRRPGTTTWWTWSRATWTAVCWTRSRPGNG